MSALIVQPGCQPDSPFSVFIMGPTATGKTDLAIALYNEVPAELISVDSALVYQGMDIGSAKPDAETLRRAQHHLIDIIDPVNNYSVGEFRDDALRLMADSVAVSRTPVLVGGTMLYFNALQKGIASLPAIDAGVRQRIAEEEVEKGIAVMHQRLQKIDPVSAKRIHPNDPQRIKRALEVFDSSGKTLTYFWQKQDQQCLPYRIVKIALVPPERTQLRKRIALRFELMLKQGLIEEVETLRARGDLHAALPSIRAVGYRQVWAYLDGEYDFETMREKAIIATAQLAKRQMTWLRKETDCNFIDPEQLNTKKILKKLRTLLS